MADIFELRNWVDEFLYKSFQAAKNKTKLDLVNEEARITVDQQMAIRLKAFLEENPQISTLLLECNVDREDGAMQILAESIFPNMDELLFYGDYDADGGFTEDDDGSLLECLERAVVGKPSTEKPVALALYFAEFRHPHPNCDHMNNILCQASGSLRKLDFQSCLFDPNVSFFTEGLERQTALEELQASFLFVALSQTFQWSDEQLGHIIRALPSCLRVFRLGYHCHMGHQAVQALIQWLEDPRNRKCKLEMLDFDGTDDFLARPDCQVRKQCLADVLRKYNLSLLEIHMGGERQAEYFRNCLQPTLRRNRLIVQVKRMRRGGADTCPSAKAGLWGRALATLASETTAASATPLYLALSVLSTMLSDQQHVCM